MSNPLHDKGEHFITTPKAEPFLERVIFNNRLVLLVVFLLVTVFLTYNAVQIKPNTSFERLIPLEHPYIKNFLDNRDDILNLANTVRIAVAVKEGDIFSKEYMETLNQITDEVFFLPGVDRANLKSVWTPNVRWLEVTEEGFVGGPVIPGDYDGSPESLEQLRQNILRSGEVGRLVSDNFKSTIIQAPLFEISPDTGEKLDYADLAQKLEKQVRDKYTKQNPNVTIHMVGFAKIIGDLIEGIKAVVLFFFVAIALTVVLLFWYSRSLTGTLMPVTCSLIAVFWQLGILRVLGYGLDPYSMLVPFLVFAIGISHGVQIINGIAAEAARGFDPMMAARLTFRGLYVAGMLALISDAIGFLTLLFIEIDVIKDLAVASGIGVAVIILTNLVLLPILMSYTGVSKGGIEHVKKAEAKPAKTWQIMSYFSHPSVAPISVLIAILGFFVGWYYSQDLKIGDLDKGAPELRPDSRYNTDNNFITSNYSISSDIMIVIVKTKPEQCANYKVLDTMDRLQWTLENTAGVQSTASLVTVSKQVTKGISEGSLKWFELSRNQTIINSTLGRAPQGMLNPDCSVNSLLIFLEDHKAETLERVVDELETFIAETESEDYQFLLAAGNSGVEAATNEVVGAAQNTMLVFVYAVVSILCWITFRSLRAVLCVVVPLGLTSILCQALMAQLGIGVKVATLPVIALGVGIGVDYGIYIYSKFEKYLLEGKPLQEAYYETLRTTGKAVMFTGITLAIGVGTWIFSPIKFQADMGILLTFMFLWNMVGALWLLPALARFLLRPDKMVERARRAEAKAA